MKKGLAVLTSVAMAAGMTMMLGADAADNKYFKWEIPYYYMKALDAEGYEVLRDGAVYIDRSAPGGDKDITLDLEVFIKDEPKLMHSAFCKIVSRDNNLRLVSAEGPVAKYGCSPYKKITSDEEISAWCREDINMIGFMYNEICIELIIPAWETTGEKSDDYPLACFKAEVSKDAPAKTYFLDYPRMHENFGGGSNFCGINWTDPRGPSSLMGHEFLASDYSPPFYIHVSDRALGDVNGDGTVNEEDAQRAMEIYAQLNTSSLTADERQIMAADVNGNEMVDDEDVALILEYCAKYKDKTPDMTINEYVRSR